MKIDFISHVQLPRSSKTGPRSAAGNATADRRIDVVDFTRGQTAVEDKQFRALKASLHSGISYPAESGRLEDLQERVRQGSYYISTDALVDSIINATD